MAFQREPIFWTSDTAADFNKQDRERLRRDAKGKLVVDRVPQRAHDGGGGYENPIRLKSARFIEVVKHCGTVVPITLTNGASHTDLNTTYASFQIRKGRHYGWFRVGSCPVALVGTNELGRDQVVDQSILNDEPCERGTFSDFVNTDVNLGPVTPGPCKHARAEIKARQAAHTARELERATAIKSDTDKLIEAQKEIQGQSTEALIELAKALAANQLGDKGGDKK
jgi:hypothetical protein